VAVIHVQELGARWNGRRSSNGIGSNAWCKLALSAAIFLFHGGGSRLPEFLMRGKTACTFDRENW